MNNPQNFPLILLAGGQSLRMGTPKGLVDYHGKPWLLEQLGRFETAGGKEVVVVLGFHLERYFEKIPWLQANGNEGLCPRALTVSVVVNQTPACGQFSSLKSAISFLLEKDWPGAFILPVDVPGPQREVYDRLSAALISKTDVAIPQYRSKGGHPVLLSRRFLGQLISLSLESNEARLDLQIRSLPPERVARVRVNDAQVRLNINLSSDFSDYADRQAGTRSRPGY